MSRRTLVPVLVLLFGVAACAGSEGESGSAAPATDAATDVAPVDSIVDDVEAEPSDTTSSDAAVDGDDDGDSGGSDQEFCDAIQAVRTAEFEFDEEFSAEVGALFDDVQSSAPPELADDVAVVIAGTTAVAELGTSAPEDDSVATDEALEILFDPAFVEANENLEAYTAQACGAGLDDAGNVDLDVLDS